jgi:hypothetical protein
LCRQGFDLLSLEGSGTFEEVFDLSLRDVMPDFSAAVVAIRGMMDAAGAAAANPEQHHAKGLSRPQARL